MLEFLQGLFASDYFSPLHHGLIVGHVAAALLALVVAPGAMLATKTRPIHKYFGRVYVGAMCAANLSALWLLAWRFNLFLFGVTIISFYGALTGYRVMHRKHGQVRWFDWGGAGLVLAIGGGLILWTVLTGLGVNLGLGFPGGDVPLVYLILAGVFGVMMGSEALTDLRLFRGPSPDRRWWWYYHMDRMLGSYIALWTAFMVQQVGPRLPVNLVWLAWVAPAAIGSPLIGMWIAHYRRKFSRPEQPAATPSVEAPLSR